MKNLKWHIASIAMSMMATPAVLADDSISANIARKYSAANWALIDTASQPYQSEFSLFDEVSSRYFDANWIAFHGNGQPRHVLTDTQADMAITMEQGED